MSDGRRRGLRLALRLLGLTILLVAAIQISSRITDALEMQLTPENQSMLFKIVLVALLSYTALMAIPFVPGVEIGLALMATLGASIAPVVYVATVVALVIAFFIGRVIPVPATCRLLRRLRLRRAAALVAKMERAQRESALPKLVDELDSGLSRLILRQRYVALAVALNIPGNAVVGGGGGLALAAGISRAFHPAAFLLTVAIAVAPVPLLVFLTGSVVG